MSWISHLFIIGLCLTLFACGGSGEGSDGDGDDDSDGDDSDDNPPVECNGDDVWYDEDTNLCWALSTSYEVVNWSDAMAYCDDLETDEHDDWQLPNIDQLRALVDGCEQIEPGGGCPIHDGSSSDEWTAMCDGTDACGVMDGPGILGCFNKPEVGNNCGPFWSSSTDASDSGEAFCIHFNYADLYAADKTNEENEDARCVRASE